MTEVVFGTVSLLLLGEGGTEVVLELTAQGRDPWKSPEVANVLAEGEWVVEWQVGLDGVAVAAAVALWRDSWPLDGLPVTEEFVVLVVAAVAAPDFRVVGDELDALDPLHLFEAELDLVAEP